jgi:hypothetical protein
VAVDASACSSAAEGSFEIRFTREKETAPDLEFLETFVWRPPSVHVVVNFSADEAVGQYRIENVSPCTCHH